MPTGNLETIHFTPVKSFFVHMLTRDITLEDSILDLIDNCVDGIQRSESRSNLRKNKPYEKYWAKIIISENRFVIEDNCGGIPWECHEYAFRIGRPASKRIDDGPRPVGVYGIGMKRAIFKIGEECSITTHSIDKSYRVHLAPEWIRNDELWDLDPTPIESAKIKGTKIEITSIRSNIAKEFKSDSFETDFRDKVATHYAFIMDKGFRIFVNNREVSPKSIKLLFDDFKKKSSTIIRPFIYKAHINGVEVFLAVGFTRPIPSSEEANESLENFKERHSSAEAGWSVICNDRTILYCDKSAVTGWGVSGVPQYHMQFIAISGIVIFNSEKAELLPTTTTKRGIDANSELYLQVRDKMIEGMKIFTQYTNEWKTKELIAESRERLKEANVVGIEELKQESGRLAFKNTRGVYPGQQYKPDLPRPERKRTTERISFTRPMQEIRQVSTYLFQTPNRNPSQVGEGCFKSILKEATE